MIREHTGTTSTDLYMHFLVLRLKMLEVYPNINICYIPAAKDGSFALDKREKEAERFFPPRETVSPYPVATTRLGPRRFDHHCM